MTTHLLLDELAQAQEQVRQKPSEDKLRIHLFQLHAQAGQWEKALAQLQVAANLQVEHKLLAHTYRIALKAENVRAQVFRGLCAPQVLGEPKPWVGYMITALQEAAQGNLAGAAELRVMARDAAQPIAGQIDGKAFEWIADADSRLGPILEVFMNGEYFWLPFESITEVRLEEPSDLRDLVWMPAHIKLANGGMHPALVPVRYPLDENETLKEHLLSRLTSWTENDQGDWTGHGVRVFTTDAKEASILDVRHIQLDQGAAATSAETA